MTEGPDIYDSYNRQVNVSALVSSEKGKELNDFQRNPLDIEILSNMRFGSLEIRDTSVTRVTNNDYRETRVHRCDYGKLVPKSVCDTEAQAAPVEDEFQNTIRREWTLAVSA
jgi:hypothetical protein